MQALKALHQKQVRRLMGSIEALKDEITVLKSKNKDHNRSKHLASLKTQLREREQVIDSLKQLVTTAAQQSPELSLPAQVRAK